LTSESIAHTCPISAIVGKEALIKAWTVEDVKAYHSTHYTPDNAIVYVVGDIDPEQCYDQLKKVFGHLPRSTRARKQVSAWFVLSLSLA
jgi:zinc protease